MRLTLYLTRNNKIPDSMARNKRGPHAKEPVRIRFRKLKDGSKSVYLDCYRNGERTYEYLRMYLVPETSPRAKELNASVMESANYIKAQRIMEITNSESGLKKSKLLSRQLLTDIMQEYSDNVRKTGSDSWRNVDHVRRVLVQYRGDRITLGQVNKEFVTGFINFLREEYRSPRGNRPLSNTTANGYCVIFSAALNMAVRREYMDENPFSRIASVDRIRRNESPRTYLTIDEVRKMIDTPVVQGREDVKQAFLFSVFCGLRRSDIRQLKWMDITSDNGQWRCTVIMEKTTTPIYLPLSKSAVQWLPDRGFSTDQDLVFNTLPSDTLINGIIRKWAGDAGIANKTVTFHTSRHTFGTMMLTLGADLYTVSKLMGHRKIETTKIYAKIVDRKKDDAVNLADNIFARDV